jgi:murein peptide amidase A
MKANANYSNKPLDLCAGNPVTLGYSVSQRAIEGFYFGETGQTACVNTLFIGAIHGDEGLSAELLTRWVMVLNEQAFCHQSVSFQTHPLLVIPVLNPDGYQAGTRVNANGVDLNRNYPTRNWDGEGIGTSYYQGSKPASEPETQLLLKLIECWKPQKIVTLHTPYRVVNYDGPAAELASILGQQSGYPVVESIGYPTPGSFGTYFGIERNMPVITLELDENDSLEQLWQTHQRVLEVAANF